MATASELLARLVELDKQIAELHSERELVEHKLSSITYPVLTLPPDIIGEIFLRYFEGHTAPQRPHSRLIRAPLILASVCVGWRAIALSTGALWNSITLESNLLRNAARTLEFWLRRAGGLPLDLNIKVAGSQDEVLAILAKYSSRWKRLNLSSNAPISFPHSSSGGPLLCLESLHLSISGSFDPSTELTVPSLDSPSYETSSSTAVCLQGDCLGILRYTIALQQLVINSSELVPNSTPPIVLSGLKELTLDLWKYYNDDGDSILLTYLTLPSLERLRICLLTDTDVNRVQSLIARSQCSIEVLELGRTEFAPAHICLSRLRTIKELTISESSWYDDEFRKFFTSMTEEANFLPALETLKLTDCEPEIGLWSLTAMLSARWKCMEGVVQLRHFSLSFEDEDLSALQDAAKARRADLAKLPQHLLAPWGNLSVGKPAALCAIYKLLRVVGLVGP
ncbi:hypothetical protein DFH06DRAFT_1430895 [Mycena polygramma]|nr:hypothetical protein DFH06DRAFT_1430895 [Mycena polygramma]